MVRGRIGRFSRPNPTDSQTVFPEKTAHLVDDTYVVGRVHAVDQADVWHAAHLSSRVRFLMAENEDIILGSQLSSHRPESLGTLMTPILKQILNAIRNVMIFRVRYPWVRHGRGVHCQWSAHFWSPRRHIVLGDDVGIGRNCLFQADTELGSKVMVASDAAFLNSDDHRYDVIGRAMWDSGRGDKHQIIVEDDVWIGHGSIILSPARIGRGAVVAAGSVVTRDVPRYAIVGGVPARVLKMRFTPEQIVEHERLLANPQEATSL
jgi:acetyltransferase-like isoleucine patch superfamily enzyme